MNQEVAEFWRKWLSDDCHYGRIPEARYGEALSLMSFVMNLLATPEIVLVDVGCARGDFLDILQKQSGLMKPVFSIGIDPIDSRCDSKYSRFVQAAASANEACDVQFYVHEESACSSLRRVIAANVVHDPELSDGVNYLAPPSVVNVVETRKIRTRTLQSILSELGVNHTLVHVVKIDAQGADIEVFRGLHALQQQCLFIQIEVVLESGADRNPRLYEGQSLYQEDVKELQASGFRLLNLADFVITPEADAIFVNTRLLSTLGIEWPHNVKRVT